MVIKLNIFFVNFAHEISKPMTVAKQIERFIAEIPEGQVFSFENLGLPASQWDSSRMKLGRMVSNGILRKASNGKYYKPRKTIFGVLPPSQKEVVKDLLFKNGQIVGYLTNHSIWNDLMLTSQISSVTVIGINSKKNPLTRNGQQIRFVFQPNEITEENVHLLQILDSIKFITQIPDANINDSVRRLMQLIENMCIYEKEVLVALAVKYTPRTRALLGAILSIVGDIPLADNLKRTLNPATKYKLGISKAILDNKNSWNIE